MRVSAVSTVSKVERSEGRGKRRHDEFVLDANLRLRRLGEDPGQQQLSGSGSALLAVHVRWWSEGEVLGWSVERMGLGRPIL